MSYQQEIEDECEESELETELVWYGQRYRDPHRDRHMEVVDKDIVIDIWMDIDVQAVQMDLDTAQIIGETIIDR